MPSQSLSFLLSLSLSLSLDSMLDNFYVSVTRMNGLRGRKKCVRVGVLCIYVL